MSAAAPAATTDLTFQFMDVGQGDCTYIEFPDGRNMLVDFGSTKNKSLTKADALTYFQTQTRFKAKGQVLDYLVLTHGDIDHYNNVQAFVQAVQPAIKNLLYGGKASDYGGLIEALVKAYPGMKVLDPPSTGPFLLASFGEAKVWVLAVNTPSTSSDKNTTSVVLQVEFAGRRVILSGDATVETEQYILTAVKAAKAPAPTLQSGALKVGHHGSARTSVSPAWITAVKPVWVFISADRYGSLGEGLRSGHRLPQELAIDIIRNNTKLGAVDAHRYFSSFDEADYTGYVSPDQNAMAVDSGLALGPQASAWKKQNPAGTAAWLNPSTTEAIFTTLTTLGLNGTDADQGVQYGMRIRSDESVQLLTT